MLNFFAENWVNLLLVIVTGSALIVYILQERKKVSDAASLIKMQIDEIQNGIAEIDSYIINGQLNSTAFYESQPLIKEDYWSKYKHYFVKKMSSKDFATISKLFNYASEIQEQQILMKTLQNNYFYFTQQSINTVETAEIIRQMDNSNAINLISSYKEQVLKQITKEFDEETVQKISTSFEIVFSSNFTIPNNLLENKQKVYSLINQNYLTAYCPLQIKLSLEKYIKKYTMLEIDGTDGYKKIKKISERKF